MWILQTASSGKTPEFFALIGLMGSALTALGSFVIWLYKQTLSRADARVTLLEQREADRFTALAKNIDSILAMMQTVVELVKEVRQMVTAPRER